jgi:hypothetical protein
MKKTLIIILFLLNANSLFGQNNNRFIFASSYGLSYIDYGGKFYALPPEFETNNIVTDINSIGTVMGFELDYNIKNNNYVGVGFSRQHHSKKVNNTFYFNNNEFTLDNYQSNLNKTLIDIRYKRVYKYFTWSAGLFYFWESYATPSIYTNDSGGVNIILDNSYNNKDQFGFYASAGCLFPIKNNINLGIQTKAYYSFAGIETISLAPFIAFRF